MNDPAEILARERLRRESDRSMIRNPSTGRILGDVLGLVDPNTGEAVARSMSGLERFSDRVDIGAGGALQRAGVPSNWLASKELVSAGPISGGVRPMRELVVPRASKPLAYGAGVLGVLAAGKYVSDKLKAETAQAPLTKSAGDTMNAHVLAAAVLDRQQAAIHELCAGNQKLARYTASLIEAAELARDGVIDPSDILERAAEINLRGDVKTSSIDEVFSESPGVSAGPARGNTDGLDPITKTLRELRNG